MCAMHCYAWYCVLGVHRTSSGQGTDRAKKMDTKFVHLLLRCWDDRKEAFNHGYTGSMTRMLCKRGPIHPNPMRKPVSSSKDELVDNLPARDLHGGLLLWIKQTEENQWTSCFPLGNQLGDHLQQTSRGSILKIRSPKCLKIIWNRTFILFLPRDNLVLFLCLFGLAWFHHEQMPKKGWESLIRKLCHAKSWPWPVIK